MALKATDQQVRDAFQRVRDGTLVVDAARSIGLSTTRLTERFRLVCGELPLAGFLPAERSARLCGLVAMHADKGRRIEFDEDMTAALLRLLRNGLTQRAAAQRMGMSESRLRKEITLLRQQGVRI